MRLAPIMIAAGCVAALTLGAVGGVALAGSSGAAAGNGGSTATDLVALDSMDQTALNAADVTGAEVTGVDVTSAGAGSAQGRRVAGRLCARIPQAITNTENLQQRLAGDASTRGSLLWLQGRIQAAQAGGQVQLAQVLRDREKMLTDLQPVLSDRLTMLRDAEQLCAGQGAASAASPAATATS